MDIQNANRILRPPQIIEESYNTYYPSDVVFQQEMGLDALGDGSLGRSMVTQSLRFSKDVLNLFFKGSIPSADIVTDKEFIQILNSIPPEMLARAADDTSSILGVLENDSVKEKLMPYTKISSEMVRRTKDSNYPMLLSIIYNKHYGLKDIVEKTDIETFKKIPEDTVFELSKQKNVLTTPEHIKSRVEYFSTPEYQTLLQTLISKSGTNDNHFENALQAKLISSMVNPEDVLEYVKGFDMKKLEEMAPRVRFFKPEQLLEFLFYHSEKKTELTEENLKYSGHLSHDSEKELIDITALSKVLSRYPNTNRRIGHLPAAWMEGVPKEQQKDFTDGVYNAIQTFSESSKTYDGYKKFSDRLEQLFGEKTKVTKVGSGEFGYVVKISVGDKPPFALKLFKVADPVACNKHGGSIEPQSAMFAKNHANNFSDFYFGQVADKIDLDGFMVSEFLSNDAPKGDANHFVIDRLSSSDSIKSLGHNYLGGKLCDYGEMYAPDKELLENKSIAQYVRIITDNLVKPKGVFLYQFNDKRLEIVKNVIQSSKTPQDVQKAIEIIEKYGTGKVDQRAIYQLKQMLH